MSELLRILAEPIPIPLQIWSVWGMVIAAFICGQIIGSTIMYRVLTRP